MPTRDIPEIQSRLEALLLSSPPFLSQLRDPPWTVSWVWGNRLREGRGVGGEPEEASELPGAMALGVSLSFSSLRTPWPSVKNTVD